MCCTSRRPFERRASRRAAHGRAIAIGRLIRSLLAITGAVGAGFSAAADERDAPVDLAQPQEITADESPPTDEVRVPPLDSTEPFSIPFIEEAPRIDGVIEDLWSEALVIEDLRQVDPVEGGTPSQRTRISMMRDASTLYVAVRCDDTDAPGIRATQLERDGAMGADDLVTLVIDPRLDRRNGYIFDLNPAGARRDGRLYDNSRTDFDWDGIWYGDSTIDGTGWTAEYAIPFRTVSPDRSVESWGINVQRFIRRDSESIRWAAPRRSIPLASVSNAAVVGGFEMLDLGLGIDVRPFVTFSARDLKESAEFDADAGVDLFWQLPPALTLSITINTDFAETEVDQRQINFGRFPLFFPEKRAFFLEDNGVFNFGGIRRNPLPFYSRRIGIVNGEQQPILAGAKLTGRVDEWEVGLLNVQMKSQAVDSSRNYTVARVKRDVLELSSIGAIFTAGDPEVGNENYVGGLDFSFRRTDFQGDKTLTATAYGLYSESPDLGSDQWSAGFKVDYPNDEIDWGLGFTRIGEDYDAALGFNPRTGIHEYFADWRYRWRPEALDGIRLVDFSTSLFTVTDLGGDIESASADIDFLRVQTDRGDDLRMEYRRVREVPEDGFNVAGRLPVEAGDYSWNEWSVNGSTTPGRPLAVRGSFRHSGFYGGTRRTYTAGVDWRASSHFFLGGSYTFNDIDLPSGSLLTRQLTARVNFFFSPDMSLTNFVQYDSLSGTLGINSRFRWTIEPGSDVFIVVNNLLDAEETDVQLLNTEVVTKIGWSFRF